MSVMDRLYTDGARQLAEEGLNYTLEKMSDKEHSSSKVENGDKDDSDDSVVESSSHNASFSLPKRALSKASSMNKSSTTMSKSFRINPNFHVRRVAQRNLQLSAAVLPSGCQNVPIEFFHWQMFFGASSIGSLEAALDGADDFELKGLRYWISQLMVMKTTCEKLKEDVRLGLDEKRNFFSFILTVVTVGLAPLTILTGYWYCAAQYHVPNMFYSLRCWFYRGMNFDNMVELDSSTYKSVPGVKLLWSVIILTSLCCIVESH